MSLITDVDYFRHRLRLAYLRHSDDPYAARIVSFPNNYESNPYIHAAGLDNTDKWPELNAPSSPVPTPLEELPQLTRGGGGSLPQPITEEQGKWPGATGLKYTQTIMGSRSGVAGMRVNGRRTSKMGSPYVSGTLRSAGAAIDARDAQNDISTPAAPPPNDALANSFAPPADPTTAEVDHNAVGGTENRVFLTEATPSPATPTTTTANEPVPGLPDLPPLPPGFRPPKFARGAEMEARRRKRIQMRMPQRVVSVAEDKPPPQAAARPALHFDDTSSEEEESDEQEEGTAEGSASDSEGSDAGEMPSDFEDVSFLRPYGGQRTTSNGSDGVSLLSAQLGLSVSQASVNSSLQAPRTRLSPVAEQHGKGSDQTGALGLNLGLQPGAQPQHSGGHPRRPSRTHGKGGGSGDISSAGAGPSGTTPSGGTNTAVNSNMPSVGATAVEPAAAARPSIETNLLQPRKTSSSSKPPKSATLSSKSSVPAFRKKAVPSVPRTQSQSSALTARLAAKSSSTTNPFHYLYAGISGREDSHYVLRVYFPHSVTYRHTPREIRVRKDVSVEEVIGHALWVYWEDKAEPNLAEAVPEGMEKKVWLSSAGWCLRIVEEDTEGEVDEDYPVIGRGGPISRWLQHELAVCEAPPQQIKQNLDLDSAIVRRASRLMKSSQAPNTTEEGEEPAPVRRRQEGTGYSDDEILPPPIVHQTGTGERVLLRVRWADFADSAHYWTTLGVTTDTYMADILEMACRKRRLPNSKDWALLLEDRSVLVPLDRTVTSLLDKRSLIIMKRSLLDTLEPGQGKKPGRSNDPNASIFDRSKHYSDIPQDGPELATYKKFTVRRKVPMVFGAHERILAMDGDYVHIIPIAAKALLDSAKTNSYHIKMVIECILVKSSRVHGSKDTSTIRLIIQRDDLTRKKYDFEADNHASAVEIVNIIKSMQRAYENANGSGGPGVRASVVRGKSTRRLKSPAATD